MPINRVEQNRSAHIMDAARNESSSAEFSSFRYRCAHCDEVHMGLPDVCFPVPDCIRDLPDSGFSERCLVTDDICIVDGKRYFIHCVLEVPVEDHPDRFGWGLWCEVGWVPFKRYWEVTTGNLRAGRGQAAGRVSNELTGIASTDGLKCEIDFRTGDLRPLVTLPPSKHPLYRMQQRGMTVSQAITQAQSVGTLLKIA
jgi:hypothetical protein